MDDYDTKKYYMDDDNCEDDNIQNSSVFNEKVFRPY